MNNIYNAITLEPPMKGYLEYAYPLSILFAQDKCYMSWLFQHYIQVVCKNDFSEFKHADNDWMHLREGALKCNYICLPKSIFTEYTDFEKIIIPMFYHMLKDGFYFSGVFNERFIPQMRAYKKYDYDHDYLIFGGDFDAKTFKILGYSNHGLYEAMTITFEQYFNAVLHTKYENVIVNFLKINLDNNFCFNSEKTMVLLKDYLHSSDSVYGYDGQEFCFGINAVRRLCDYIDNLGDHGIDLRFFYFLWEHKKLMLSRIEFLMNKGLISSNVNKCEKYYHIINQTKVLLNLCIKYNISNSKEILQRIKAHICEVADKEEQLLIELYTS